MTNDQNDAIPEDFNPETYLFLNKDVAAAGLDPFDHYRNNGRSEGRLYRYTAAQADIEPKAALNLSDRNNAIPEDFDPETYLFLNKDVAAAGLDPFDHYRNNGRSEGRLYRYASARGGPRAIHNADLGVDPSVESEAELNMTNDRTGTIPEDFDPEMYLLLNTDVAAAGKDPFDHYRNHGRSEGRLYRFSYAQDGLHTIHNADFRVEPNFVKAYARGVKANDNVDLNWHWRVHVGLWAARVASKLAGDFIECGVNRGFLSSAIMVDLDWDRTGKTFWLLDTFSGIDTEGISSEENDPGAKERNAAHFESGLYTSNLEGVRKNFSEWKNVEIVVGSVPGTLQRVTSDQIAFASIDMNSAPPEIAALEFLWPRLVHGGAVLFDDYTYHGYLPQKLALDEWAAKNRTHILSLPTGQGLLLKPHI